MGRPKKIQAEDQVIEQPVEQPVVEDVKVEIPSEDIIEDNIEEEPVPVKTEKEQDDERYIIDEVVVEEVEPVILEKEEEPVIVSACIKEKDIDANVSLDQYPKHPEPEVVYFATESFRPF